MGVGCRVKVNSERVSLETPAEACEQLCGPDIGMEFVHCGAKTEKSCDFVVRPLIALCDGARHPAEVVEWCARAGVCVGLMLGGRQGQFR